jgi:hypothetical protein
VLLLVLNVTTVLQGYYKGVTRALPLCFRVATGTKPFFKPITTEDTHPTLQGGYEGVTRVLQGCYKVVQGFYKCHKNVTRGHAADKENTLKHIRKHIETNYKVPC